MGNAPLHLAAARGSLACVRLLLDARAEPDARNNVRRRRLSRARITHRALTHLPLCAVGTRQDGFTALHCAAQLGWLECVRLLLLRGADKEARIMARGDAPCVR
jgi:ankyrin repeat protein